MTISIRTAVETLLLPNVQRPMRYAGGELNCIRKDLSAVALHGVICFPDLYDIGMSHTGLQILYHIVNKEPLWALSRCFHPWGDAETVMRTQRIPLYTLEYFTPVREADWIGFSVQYELHYTNIVNMLDLAGLSPLRSERCNTDPLIIAGGPVVANPEPLAPFVDLFLIGDGEGALPLICRQIEHAKAARMPRSELMERLSTISGVYVPSLCSPETGGCFQVPRGRDGTGPVVAAKLPELEDKNFPDKPVVPLIEVVHRRLAVEVMRGCTRGCRFCSAGIYYRPVRERSPVAVSAQIQCGVESTGWEEVGLLSLSTADYSSLSPLLLSLKSLQESHHISCSLPSTRLDALEPGQLALLEGVSPLTSFTIAPEAGSERLRRVINKDFTDATIFAAVGDLMRRNVRTLKLYFMLGLPTETREDIDAIVDMTIRIAGMVRAAGGGRTVNVSLSPFSPKPHTPFEREPMDAPESLLEKGMYVKRALRHLKNVKAVYRDPGQTLLETLMARGDRRIGDLVYDAWKRGARFDGWDECFNLGRWTDAAAALSIDPQKYVGAIADGEPLPWSLVSMGVSTAFLEQELQRARAAAPTADCRTAGCIDCGVCGSTLRPVFERHDAGASITGVAAIPAAAPPATGTRRQFRFYYRKTDVVRFLGHLDMVAVIHRACLMARWPLAYSNGFNPHPRIAFGPPLPFGVSGEREAFDAVLTAEGEVADWLAVNRWLPEGLKIHDYHALHGSVPSLNETINAGSYSFRMPDSVDGAPLSSRIAEVLAESSVLIDTEKKGAAVKKNIRPGIIECVYNEEEKIIRARLGLKTPNSCKPAELLSALFNSTIPDVFVCREECLMLDQAGKSLKF